MELHYAQLRPLRRPGGEREKAGRRSIRECPALQGHDAKILPYEPLALLETTSATEAAGLAVLLRKVLTGSKGTVG